MALQDIQTQTKNNQKPFFRNLSYYFTEYCDNTSIHGLKFLGERKRSIFEKLWWIIFVSGSLYVGSVLIRKTYIKWINAPVFVSFATSETQIWNIPFPAVTICPLVNVDQDKLCLDIHNESRYEELELQYISLICPKLFNKVIAANTLPKLGFFEDDINNFFINVAPNLSSIVYSYNWLGKEGSKPPETILTPMLTSGGVCYTYNMLDRDDIFTKETSLNYYNNRFANHQPKSNWSLRNGYPKNSEFLTYPRRTFLAGGYGALKLILHKAEKDFTRNCRSPSKGFKIIIHHPAEMPRFHQNYVWVPLDKIVSVSISPNMMKTSADLKDYHPNARHCYFQNEKTLKFFQIYNQQNCLFECLSNFTYRNCNCVGFYMPRDNSTPICGLSKQNCVETANVEFIAKEASLSINSSSFEKPVTDCNCLPSCFSLRFNAETSQLDWNWQESSSLRDDVKTNQSHFSKVRIFFKELQFIASERNELYGQAEFWANCGGLIGLFTGFSFISLIEILYFVTLRLFCNVKNYGRKNWSGSDELIEIKLDMAENKH